MTTATLRRAAAGHTAVSHQENGVTGMTQSPVHQQPQPAMHTSSGRAGASNWPQEQPLVLPNHTAFKALLVTPLVIWWVAMALGIWLYEGLPHGGKVWHAMSWFDRGFLRPAGPLLPFAVLAARVAIHVIHHLLPTQQQAATPSSSSKGRRVRLRLGTLALTAGLVYVVLAAVRLLVYLAHYWALNNRYLAYHLVSDHIFLAATLLASLQVELVCCAADMLATLGAAGPQAAASSGAQLEGPPPVSFRELALTALFVVTSFLYLFVVGDMFYTARYYHFPLESGATVLAGLLAFQGPVLVWLVRRRQAPAAVRTA